MTLLSLSLLGGLVGLDGTSVGQFMVSRPIVAATITGWLLGDAVAGLAIGTVLELLHLSVLAVGGARFPEVGPASVVGAATALATPGAGGLAMGCFMALVWGQIGGVTIVILRRTNARLVPDPFRGPVSPMAAEIRHLGSVGLDFLRGTAVTGAGVVVGGALAVPAASGWPLGEGATQGVLLLGAALVGGALLRSLGGVRRRGVVFGLALSAGLVAGLVL